MPRSSSPTASSGQPNPVPTLATYHPKPGHEDALLRLVMAHYPALLALGLVTPKPPLIFKAFDKRSDAIYFVELFEWATADSSNIAHQTPEVMALWEPMGNHMETMTLARVEPLEPELAG